MEPQNPPPKIARLADNATSRTSCREVSPPTGLGLGLELGHHRSSNRHGCSKSSGFTFLQLQELEQQALIYNYIEAGLAVPRHLVLPIWKSFAGYLSSVNGACLQQQYFANCKDNFKHNGMGNDRDTTEFKDISQSLSKHQQRKTN
ncbi:growth-regulating factor 10-like isoform X4 [Camellia sinensis]|uniref:growth-regulating factor 10-like isoform X4 n=1 Tax=Camellia sinensis TaxID=4442 RepID=UPI001035A824|nr:growth-regulating factor 10-like isoform X4 [Camellia sinensis]